MTGYGFSPRTLEDLNGIWDYSEKHWGADQADRYLRQIASACLDLAENRRKGRDAGDIRTGYFRYAVGSHVLFYRFDKGGPMEVVRILHKRMDVARHL